MNEQKTINDWILQAQHQIENSGNFNIFVDLIDTMSATCLPQLLNVGLSVKKSQALLIKVSNFLLGKCQYIYRHDYLLSKPYALIVDPSNRCPLNCPGCLHNRVFQEKIRPDWPIGNLDSGTYGRFIREFGPYASNILFYNWGEPLVNKNTPEFIREAKKYLLTTSMSSNLSVHFEAEDLVRSGLDYLILSIDGAAQESYSHYRKGGNLDLVIGNVRKLVAAKKKYNVTTPYLSWQFLLFEHNKKDLQAVKQLAMDLGVNELRISTPYNIIWDESLVPETISSGEKEVVHFREAGGSHHVIDANLSEYFADELKVSWRTKRQQNEHKDFGIYSGKTCQWLYSSIVMDATGRYLPCCYVPRKNSGFTWIFGSSEDNEKCIPFNSEYYQFSRQHFSSMSRLSSQYGKVPELHDEQKATYCTACPDTHIKPLVNDSQLYDYLKSINEKNVLTTRSMQIISQW